MKAVAMIFGVFAALLALVEAQVPTNLPECGTTCMTNMLGKAGSEFDCSDADISCLCSEINFYYGIRDCANEVCSSASDADTVKAAGVAMCQNAGVDISGASVTGSFSATGTATTTLLATAESTTTGSEGTGATASATVSPIVSTNSDGSLTTIGSVTVSGSGSEVTSTATTTGTESITASNDSTTLTQVTTHTGETTATSEASGSEGTSGASKTASESASSTTSGNFAAQQTVGPVGVLAVAGMVAMLL